MSKVYRDIKGLQRDRDQKIWFCDNDLFPNQKPRNLPRKIPVTMSKASKGVENLKSSITPTEGGAGGLSSTLFSDLSS